MNCMHGLGIGHTIVDALMLVPVIGTTLWYIRLKFSTRGKKDGVQRSTQDTI
jgi:hypothetical protein